MAYLKKLNKKTICELINASVEEEAKAGHEYAEILEVLPDDEEYEECSEAIVKIMEDEINHAITLIKIGRKLSCKEPKLDKEDKELLAIIDHVHEIEIK